MPYRKLFGEAELDAVTRVFEDSWREGVDFGYQGKQEDLYTKKFCEFQGGGFADGVSSGTAALHLALLALDIEAGSDVIVSPVTNPGSVTPIIIQGNNVVVADSEPTGFNVGPDEFEAALTDNTKAAILTHLAGIPMNIGPIAEIAKSREVKLIEDCSQAHGALFQGKRVGRFGDIAAFSTGFPKNHSTGGTGGLIYTESEDYYWKIRSLADRGKAFDDPDFDPKDAGRFLFPALNFNLDELSCAIGISTLSRLQNTIDRRYEIAQMIDSALEASSVVFPCQTHPHVSPSLYFHTVEVDEDKLTVSKQEFAEAIVAEGIGINPRYSEVVSEWKWIQDYAKGDTDTPNAVGFRDRTFNILFNERFTDKDIQDIIASILKVESVFKKA